MQVKGSIDGSRHGRSFGASHRAYDRVRQGQGLKITDLPPDLPAILEYIIIIYVLNTMMPKEVRSLSILVSVLLASLIL